jgi:hypothetical protein
MRPCATRYGGTIAVGMKNAAPNALGLNPGIPTRLVG